MPPKKKPPTSFSKGSCCICCRTIQTNLCSVQVLVSNGCIAIALALTRRVTKSLKRTAIPSSASRAVMIKYKREILLLKDSVEELKRELAKLKESLSAAQSRSTASIATDKQEARPSYATATRSGESHTASTN